MCAHTKKQQKINKLIAFGNANNKEIRQNNNTNKTRAFLNAQKHTFKLHQNHQTKRTYQKTTNRKQNQTHKNKSNPTHSTLYKKNTKQQPSNIKTHIKDPKKHHTRSKQNGLGLPASPKIKTINQNQRQQKY